MVEWIFFPNKNNIYPSALSAVADGWAVVANCDPSSFRLALASQAACSPASRTSFSLLCTAVWGGCFILSDG